MSERHHCFQIQTPSGIEAKIHGDPNMQPATVRALAELINAVSRMANACPYCRSSEIEPHEIAGVVWMHCNLCQSDFDPLDNAVRVEKGEALIRHGSHPEAKLD